MSPAEKKADEKPLPALSKLIKRELDEDRDRVWDDDQAKVLRKFGDIIHAALEDFQSKKRPLFSFTEWYAKFV